MRNKGLRFNFNSVLKKRKKENRQKANDDQNVSWDDAYNLDSFSENKNANVQNKSQLHNENS